VYAIDVAKERDAEGDLILRDMGDGLPFRPGVFDAAVRFLVYESPIYTSMFKTPTKKTNNHSHKASLHCNGCVIRITMVRFQSNASPSSSTRCLHVYGKVNSNSLERAPMLS